MAKTHNGSSTWASGASRPHRGCCYYCAVDATSTPQYLKLSCFFQLAAPCLGVLRRLHLIIQPCLTQHHHLSLHYLPYRQVSGQHYSHQHRICNDIVCLRSSHSAIPGRPSTYRLPRLTERAVARSLSATSEYSHRIVNNLKSQ